MSRIGRAGFKKQVMFVLTISSFIGALIIGGAVYFFETHQVKKNATYLIQNTTRQAAVMLNDRLNLVFTQYNKMTDKTSLWRLVNQTYQEEDSPQKYKDILECYRDMKEIYSANSEIMDSLYFATSDGTSIPLYKDMIFEKRKINLEDMFQKNYEENYGYYWLNKHEDQVFPTRKPRYVVSLIQCFKNTKGEAAGYMVLNFKSSYIEKLLEKAQISENGYMMLLSDDGFLGGTHVEEKYRLSEKTIREILHKENENMEKEGFSIYQVPLEINGWILVSVVPVGDLVSSSRQFLVILGITILIILLIAGIFSLVSASMITRPIEKLTERVIEFQTNQNVSFPVDKNMGYEMRILAEGLSKLKERVEELLRQVKEEQEEKSKLELLIVQEQIKPHFLYNTLSSIKQLISMEENQKAEDMCEALSRFYRLGLSDGRDFITIQEEAEHVENYLLIQRYRYAANFDYSINIADDILKVKLLKLSLQPLVENAIYHGIKKKEEFGTIVISGYEENDFIYLKVFDDGIGMSEEELKELQTAVGRGKVREESNHFGLRNVNHRLKLYFGEEAKLVFESTYGMYTQVTMVLPKTKGEKEC